MFLSKRSWMLLGVGMFAVAGCGGADWDQANEVDSTEVAAAEEAEALTASGTPPKRKILSLGDSIAFGFNPYIAPTPVTNYVGYPEFVESKGHNVINGSCPGETSSSFFSTTAADNGCRQFKAAFALHDDYETTQSVFAVAQIKKAGKDGKPFDFVTLNIGANDLFLLQASCLPTPNPLACIQAGLPAVINQYNTNLQAGYTQVKGAGFSKTFVGVTTYAVNYNDPVAVQALGLINGALKTFTTSSAVKGKLVDAYALFQAASAASNGDACAAELLIRKPDNSGCDIHPSQKGREIIGNAVLAAINPPPN
jgi:lysophospholipase L1-like esterase